MAPFDSWRDGVDVPDVPDVDADGPRSTPRPLSREERVATLLIVIAIALIALVLALVLGHRAH